MTPDTSQLVLFLAMIALRCQIPISDAARKIQNRVLSLSLGSCTCRAKLNNLTNKGLVVMWSYFHVQLLWFSPFCVVFPFSAKSLNHFFLFAYLFPYVFACFYLDSCLFACMCLFCEKGVLCISYFAIKESFYIWEKENKLKFWKFCYF